MTGDLAEALAISQDLLDRTGDAFATGDVEAFCDCFAVPTVIDTFEGQVQLNSRAEVAERFHSILAHKRSDLVTDMVRHIVAVEWFNDETIHSTHQSRFLSGTTLTQEPFVVFSILKKIDSHWQITFSQYAIADSDNHNSALIGAKTSEEETQND